MLAQQVAEHAIHVLAAPAPKFNPSIKPSAIPGLAGPLNTLLAYIKWAVLIIIIGAGFVGAGAIAGGRAFGHHSSSKIGIAILMAAVAGAVLYVGMYTLLNSLTGNQL